MIIVANEVSPEAKASLKKFRHPEQAELVSAPLKDP
jgi:hypothetical protein